MAAAYRCEACSRTPRWRIERWGDAAVSWACASHLSIVCESLQRDWEVTRLSVQLARRTAPLAASDQTGQQHPFAQGDVVHFSVGFEHRRAPWH